MNAPTPGRVGVLGGTFDPIHNGHLVAASQCAAQLGLGSVVFIPSAQPPHKPAPHASAADRLAMVEAAIAGHPGWEAADLEVIRDGPSYTVDTLRELRAAAPDSEFWLLIGWDAARELDSWHEADALTTLAQIAVFNRGGAGDVDAAALRRAGLPDGARLLTIDSPEIAASDIRARLRDGLDASELLPEAVLRYVREHHLYTHAG